MSCGAQYFICLGRQRLPCKKQESIYSDDRLKKAPPGGRTAATDDIDAAMAELDMENYDAEEDGGGEAGVTGVFGNSNPGLAYYANNAADPYIKLAAAADALDDSEKDDFEIRGDDFLLLAAKNEDDVSHLEARRRQLCA